MTACDACLRRSGLLSAVCKRIEIALRRRRSVPALFALDDRALLAALDLDPAEAEQLLSRIEPGRLREQAIAAGLNTLCRHDRQFPPKLRESEDCCAALFMRGSLSLPELLAAAPAVAVVGSRRASPYGLEVARSLARELAACDLTVISGMAFGVDAAAHAGALDRSGATIAVLAGGAERAYPRSNFRLYERIVSDGLVVSELPPGSGVSRWCFPARNRIMAGLAAMTVVVEGRRRSGSLITAQFAQELGREVGAVPGQVTSELSTVPNDLIADGACVVRSAADVLDALYDVCGAGLPGERPRPRPAPPPPELTSELRSLLAAVERGDGAPEAIDAGGADVAAVVAGLTELELLGLIRCDAGGRYIRCVS